MSEHVVPDGQSDRSIRFEESAIDRPLYTLFDIRDVIFSSWNSWGSTNPAEQRIRGEVVAVCGIEAWSSACVLVGRLTEASLPTGSSKSAPALARRIDERWGTRTQNGARQGSSQVAGHSIRMLRNYSAHFEEATEITEREATLAVVSYAVIQWSLRADSHPDELIVRRQKVGERPHARLFEDLSDEDALEQVSSEGIGYFRELIRDCSLGDLQRLNRRINRFGMESGPYADALMLELPHILRIIGQSRGTAVWDFANYLKSERLRPLRFILLALTPFDGTWLTTRLRQGKSLHATTRRLHSMRQAKHLDWTALAKNDAQSMAYDASLLWAAWQGTPESAHQPIDLTYAVPAPLAGAMRKHAPENAIVWHFERPLGFYRIGDLLSWYRSRDPRSPEFLSKIAGAAATSVEAAQLPSRCAFIAGMLSNGNFAQANLDTIAEIVLSSSNSEHDSVDLLLTTYSYSPRFGARLARRILPQQSPDLLTWRTLVVLGVASTYQVLHPRENLSSLGEFEFGTMAEGVPEDASRLAVSLAIYAARSLYVDADMELLAEELRTREQPDHSSPYLTRLLALLAAADDSGSSVS